MLFTLKMLFTWKNLEALTLEGFELFALTSTIYFAWLYIL